MSAARPAPFRSPETARSRGDRIPLDGAVVLLCAIGLAGAARAPSFPTSFWMAFAVAGLMRLTLGRDGRAFLPRRLLRTVGYAVSALALAYLFHRLGRRGSEALTALMSVVCVLETLVLLWRRTVFGSFLLILFSSVHAAGAAFDFKDEAGLLVIGTYMAALVWTVLLFERRAASEHEQGTHDAARNVRPDGERPLPLRSALGTAALLIVLGFPLGIGIYLAMPRGLFPTPDLHNTDREADEDPGLDEHGFHEPGQGPPDSTRRFAFTGPGGKGVPLGSVAEIKKDLTPWFEVSLEGSKALPPTVVLRENVQDFLDADMVWRDSLSVDRRARAHLDGDDGSVDGWYALGVPNRPEGYMLRIALQRGGHKRLYLQPHEVRLRLLRQGKVHGGYRISESRNKTYEMNFPLKQGDVILQRTAPWIQRDARLVGRRSDSAVSPQVSYLQVPEICRAPLEAQALAVIGQEQDPWRRARKLETWLKSEAFTYTLSIPRLDRANPLVDFVERTRSGNCELFASALTMMLRTLGHPARYVRGFWGGDEQKQRGSYLLRGYHYHAWTEMYLNGAGWIPLNPTPPDRRPADAESFTIAAQRKAEADAEQAQPFSFLGYDGPQWSNFWRGIATWLKTHLFLPLARLFSAERGFLGVPLLVLLLWFLRRQRAARRLKRMVVAPGRKLPAGPYGQALLALAGQGVRRRPTWTAREFALVAGRRLPAIAEPLERLTALFEAERYGGASGPEQRIEGGRALARLRSALKGK